MSTSGHALSATYARKGVRVFDVREYGALCDLKRVTDGAITAGTTTLTSATANFTAADVGKLISIEGASTTYGTVTGVIASRTERADTVTLTLDVAVETTVAAARVHYGTNDHAALQAAVDAANAASGGTVVLPGRSAQSGSVQWKDGVSLVGFGMRASGIKGIGSAANFPNGIIYGTASTAAPFEDCQFQDFELDGKAMIATGYNTAWKGLFLLYMRRAIFRNLHIHDFPATGLGCDYILDGVIDSCIVNGNGRLNNGTSHAGGNGIGIGTGKWQDENITIANCHAADNKRHQIFVEQNGSFLSRYAKVIGCHVNGIGGNDMGISDCGTEYFICMGNTVEGSGKGIYSGAGTVATPTGRKTLIVNNITRGCVYSGIQVTGTGSTTAFQGNITIRGNRCESGIREGIFLVAGPYTPTSIVVENNECHANGKAGIHFGEDGGTFNDVTISNNRCYDNGGGFSGLRPHGIEISSNVTDLMVIGNKLRDTRSSGKTQANGFYLKTGFTATRGVITGNYCEGNSAAGITIAGTLTTVSNVSNYGQA